MTNVRERNEVVMSLWLFICQQAHIIGKRFDSDQEELAQVGVVSVLENFKHFNPKRGVKPISYFGKIAINAMTEYGWRENTITLPRHRSVKKSPRMAQRAETVRNIASLGSLAICATTEKEPDLDQRSELAALKQAVSALPDRLRTIVGLRMKRLSLSSIGRRFCLSKERIRQLEGKANDQLRESLVGSAAYRHQLVKKMVAVAKTGEDPE